MADPKEMRISDTFSEASESHRSSASCFKDPTFDNGLPALKALEAEAPCDCGCVSTCEERSPSAPSKPSATKEAPLAAPRSHTTAPESAAESAVQSQSVARGPEQQQQSPVNAVTAKTCSRCLELKLFEHFARDKSHSDGLASRCKACVALVKRRRQEVVKTTQAEKVCSSCKVSKSHREFFRDASHYDGLASRCKGCKKSLATEAKRKRADGAGLPAPTPSRGVTAVTTLEGPWTREAFPLPLPLPLQASMDSAAKRLRQGPTTAPRPGEGGMPAYLPALLMHPGAVGLADAAALQQCLGGGGGLHGRVPHMHAPYPIQIQPRQNGYGMPPPSAAGSLTEAQQWAQLTGSSDLLRLEEWAEGHSMGRGHLHPPRQHLTGDTNAVHASLQDTLHRLSGPSGSELLRDLDPLWQQPAGPADEEDRGEQLPLLSGPNSLFAQPGHP